MGRGSSSSGIVIYIKHFSINGMHRKVLPIAELSCGLEGSLTRVPGAYLVVPRPPDQGVYQFPRLTLLGYTRGEETIARLHKLGYKVRLVTSHPSHPLLVLPYYSSSPLSPPPYILLFLPLLLLPSSTPSFSWVWPSYIMALK